MTTHFDPRLSDRDYASYLLHVGDLLEWAKSKRLHLKTTPPIEEKEFVQVEFLLCAIERNANNLTEEQALSIVLNDPVLKNDPVFQKYPDDIDPSTCRWLLGAEAHRKWRELLSGAVTAHELTLLDFGSKLPIKTAQASSPETPPPVMVESASNAPGNGKVWTPEKLAEVKAYRERHGTKKTAEYFKVSASLIRQKLPAEKPKPNGYSAFTHRTK